MKQKDFDKRFIEQSQRGMKENIKATIDQMTIEWINFSELDLNSDAIEITIKGRINQTP